MAVSRYLQAGIAEQAVVGLVERVTAALPRVLSGLVFLLAAIVVVKAVLWFLRRALAGAGYGDSDVHRQFVVTVVSILLWFAVGLTFLSVVGLDGIAASLGTATGFVALGVSYALSGMIADVVSGVYLLKDPDFMPGDTVTVGDVTGDVRAIELRKTRLTVDGDTLVMANADVEKRWRKREN
ncbi:hypothetical protein BRC81_15785 [Halobacteriales archaeon QS_1_68_20]|nr:MAG: hypothetical protein BRC81_15785 [Halobacteriales archaeon QS_1_68_20]